MVAKTLPFGSQPDIIVIMTDDGPLDSISAQSMPNLTSNYGSGANGGWVSLTNASGNSPLCAPSRGSTLSGRYTINHGVVDNNSGGVFDYNSTFMLACQRAGYKVGGYGKLFNHYGVDFWYGANNLVIPPGFNDFKMFISEPGYGGPDGGNEYSFNENGVQVDYGLLEADYSTDVSNTDIQDFINACPTTTPYLVYWAPNSPHNDGGVGPVPAHRDIAASITLAPTDAFNPDDTYWNTQPQWLRESAPTQLAGAALTTINNEHTLGLRACLSVDKAIKDIIDVLISRGTLNRTFIFVCTDNAHSYGEQRLSDKGTSFEASTQLLLKVFVPLGTNVTRTQVVNNIDIAPTVCHIAGAKQLVAPDGMSFYSVLGDANATFREAALLTFYKDGADNPSFVGLRTTGYKYTRGATDENGLDGHAMGQVWSYNMATDPYELQNQGYNATYDAKLTILVNHI
jgi:arylsulfatase A-like enzyme